MTKNAQRLSQLISTFGPGAMIDLPTRSVVVGGLEQWDMKGNAFTTLPEPRLTMRLGTNSQGARAPRSGGKSFSAYAAHVGGRHVTGCLAASPPRSSRHGSSASRWRPTHPGRKRLAAGGWCVGRTSTRKGPAKVPIRRRTQERRDADPLRLRLRQGPSSRHRLAMGGPRFGTVPRADVGGGEGYQRGPR